MRFTEAKLNIVLGTAYAPPPSYEQLVLAAGEHRDYELLRIPGLGEDGLKFLRREEMRILGRRLRHAERAEMKRLGIKPTPPEVPMSAYWAARIEHAGLLRLEGLTMKEAGKRIGVSASTIQSMERKYAEKMQRALKRARFRYVREENHP